MSDALTAAAQALSAPEAIVRRSAEARARVTGVPVEDILTAWAGGTAVTTTAAVATPTTAPVEALEPTMEEAAPASSPIAVVTAPSVAAPVSEPVAEEPVDAAAPLGERVRVAGRIGAWVGALLGLVGLLAGSPWLLSSAFVAGSEDAYQPAVDVGVRGFLIATLILSTVFGMIVASLSRTVTSWVGKGMTLEAGRVTSGLAGAGTGLVLGLLAGGVLISGMGQPIEGVEGLVRIEVIPLALVMLIGGALLGWATAALVQLAGVPQGVSAEEGEELHVIRSRLSSAIGIPLKAIGLLLILVLPFAVVFIDSQELAEGGAALIAVIVSASILGFAGMAAALPGMRISRGEFWVAAAGVIVLIVIIVATLVAINGGGGEEPAATEAMSGSLF